MKAEIQSLLAVWLDEIRTRRNEDDAVWRYSSAAGVVGGLDALRVAGELTEDEHHEWHARTIEAARLGHLPPDWPVGAALPPPSPEPSPAALTMPPSGPFAGSGRFIRLVPGPSGEVPTDLGFLALPALEIYDLSLLVHWHVALSYDADASRTDWAAGERDATGLPEHTRDAIRSRRGAGMAFASIRQFWQAVRINDDVGTPYALTANSGMSASGTNLRGMFQASPAPPGYAVRLTIDVANLQFDFALSAR